jgi:hypothetical protein
VLIQRYPIRSRSLFKSLKPFNRFALFKTSRNKNGTPKFRNSQNADRGYVRPALEGYDREVEQAGVPMGCEIGRSLAARICPGK